jgi:hypothetical protein
MIKNLVATYFKFVCFLYEGDQFREIIQLLLSSLLFPLCFDK